MRGGLIRVEHLVACVGVLSSSFFASANEHLEQKEGLNADNKPTIVVPEFVHLKPFNFNAVTQVFVSDGQIYMMVSPPFRWEIPAVGALIYQILLEYLPDLEAGPFALDTARYSIELLGSGQHRTLYLHESWIGDGQKWTVMTSEAADRLNHLIETSLGRGYSQGGYLPAKVAEEFYFAEKLSEAQPEFQSERQSIQVAKKRFNELNLIETPKTPDLIDAADKPVTTHDEAPESEKVLSSGDASDATDSTSLTKFSTPYSQNIGQSQEGGVNEAGLQSLEGPPKRTDLSASVETQKPTFLRLAILALSGGFVLLAGAFTLFKRYKRLPTRKSNYP